MKNKEMIKEKPNRDCHFYNFGDNPNFEYHCPTTYGARCEFYDKFFSAYTQDPETKMYVNMEPSCKKCGGKDDLEGRIE